MGFRFNTINKWDIYPTINEPFFKFAILQEESRNELIYNQYYRSLKKIINLEMTDPNEGTFVPHHFIFYHYVLNDLLTNIEEISSKHWIESIMDLSHVFFRFSEYRTVSEFTKTYYPELLKYHDFKYYGKNGYRIREPSEFLNKMELFIGKDEIKMNDVSYNNFIKYVNSIYITLPTYLQIEHI
jgi:hypothetical protein